MSITKVVVFLTVNPTKSVLHFYEFSTIFYAFYKFLQKGYTIEDVSLRLGPWKDSGPRNWVPRPTGRRARRKSAGSGGAPGRGTARGRVHAHLGPIGCRGWHTAGTAAAAAIPVRPAHGVDHTRRYGHEGGIWTAPNDLVGRDGLDYSSAAPAFMAGGTVRMGGSVWHTQGQAATLSRCSRVTAC
jgi:hypothetical protein